MSIHCCAKQLLMQRLEFLQHELEVASKNAMESMDKYKSLRAQNNESANEIRELANTAITRHSEITERRKHLCDAMNQLWFDDSTSRFAASFAAMTSSLPSNSSSIPLLNLSCLSVWLDEQSSRLGINFAFGQDKMKQIYRDIIGQNLTKHLRNVAGSYTDIRASSERFRMTPRVCERKWMEIAGEVNAVGGIAKGTLSWCMRYEPIFRVAVGDESFSRRFDISGRIENEDSLRVVLACFLKRETFNFVTSEFAQHRTDVQSLPSSANNQSVFDESIISSTIESSKTDWKVRVQCLTSLADHLSQTSSSLGSRFEIDPTEFHRLMGVMKKGLCLQICDLRSSLAKSACESCSRIAAARPSDFLPFCVEILDALFSQVHVATKPTSEAAKRASGDIILTILFREDSGSIDDCRTPSQSLIAYMGNILRTSKHEKQRAHICTVLKQAFSRAAQQKEEMKENMENQPQNEDVEMTDVVGQREMLGWQNDAIGLVIDAFQDAKPSVKQEAMAALVQLNRVDSNAAKQVYDRLKSNQRKKFDEIVHGKSRRSKSVSSRSDIRKWKRSQINKTRSSTMLPKISHTLAQ